METVSNQTKTANHQVFIYPTGADRKNCRSFGPIETRSFADLDLAIACCIGLLEASRDPFVASVAPDVELSSMEDYLRGVNTAGVWLDSQPDLVAAGNWISVLAPVEHWRDFYGYATAREIAGGLDASHERALQKAQYDTDWYADDNLDDADISATVKPEPVIAHSDRCRHRLDTETCHHGCFAGA